MTRTSSQQRRSVSLSAATISLETAPRAAAEIDHRAAEIALTAAFAASLALMTLVEGLVPRLLAASMIVLVAALAAYRHELARLRITAVVRGFAILIPALAILGPSLGVPGAASFFAFRLALFALVLLALLHALMAPLSLPVGPLGLWSFLALWYSWVVVTAIWAPDKSVALRYMGVLLTMLLLAACTAACGSRAFLLRRLLASLGVVLALTLIVGLLEVATGWHLPIAAAASLDTSGVSASAWFVNSNNLATYLAICWPFVLMGALVARGRLWRAAALVGLLASASLVLVSGSRTSLLSISASTVICALALRRVRRDRTTRGLWIVSVILVTLLGVLLVANVSSTELLRQFRLVGVAEDIQTGTGSGGARFDVARAGADALSRYYFLGVGPGNAEVTVQQANDYDLEVENLHSWWFEVLVDSGVPGLILFVTAYLGLVLTCWRAASGARSRLTRATALAVVAGLSGFVVGAFGPSTAAGFAPMWILLGLGLAVVLRANREPHDGARRAPSRPGSMHPLRPYREH